MGHQLAGGIPLAAHQHLAWTAGQLQVPALIRTGQAGSRHIQRKRLSRGSGGGGLDRQHLLVVSHKAGNPEGQAVAMEDLREALPHHGADAPAHQRLRRVLAAGTAAEVAVDQQDRRPLMLRAIERMGSGGSLGQFGAIVGEDGRAERIEGDALEKAGRNDPIGVDVGNAAELVMAGAGLTAVEGGGSELRLRPAAMRARRSRGR